MVLAVGGAAVAANGLGLVREEASGETRSDLPPATAQVSRQTLLDTQTESGTLGYGAATVVPGRLSGTLTWLPATGATVKRGQPLYRVDNEPVLLLYGTLPAYRALSPGAEGADVEQFERNLRALGYDGFTVDDTYSSATASAVRQWQEDLGLSETGTVELGRVVYAAGQVRLDSHEAAVGDPLQPGAEVLGYTGTARVVTVELDPSDQRLVKKGGAVAVTLPDGKTVQGKIAGSQTVVSAGEGQNPDETKIEVTVTLSQSEAVASLDEATLDVAFTASQRENVLTVPVAALLALAEGGYGVQVVEGGVTRIVAVETGLFANGQVEVTGTGLTEGTTVGMPS
ncbi:peptidoglycan-binding protein [Micromonospora sp. CPCC 205371]|nr:peptidoglycan-binding protein [Micromonospora sp. CPCC 205371]